MYDLANGFCLLIAALCTFALSPRERVPALVLVSAMALNWAHYVASYDPEPPVSVLWAWGLLVHSEDVWKVADALTAICALACWVWVNKGVSHRRGWWAMAIYTLSLTQVGMHCLFWELGVLPQGAYYTGLDYLFWAQIAVLITAGGPGIVSWINRLPHRVWYVRRAVGTTQARRARR